MEYKIKILYSSRKTLALEIKDPGELLVRAPKGLSRQKILDFVAEKKNWIQKHMKRIEERKKEQGIFAQVSGEELQMLTTAAKREIPGIVERYAKIMGVDYGRITIRHQKTRWGSCSSKGNLNFNCYLMLAPQEVLEYVVVHELAHRREMNHSKAFWKIVEQYKPNYKWSKRWLKEEGVKLLS